MKKRFSDEQIISILREAEAGVPKQSQHTRVGSGGQSLNRVQICILVDFLLFLWQSVKWRFVPKSLIIPPVLTLRTGVGCQIMSRLNIEPADFIQLLRQSPKVSFAYNSLTPLFFLTLGKKGGKSNPTLCFLFLQTKSLPQTRLRKGCCHCYQPRQKLLGVFERMNCVSWDSSVSFYHGQRRNIRTMSSQFL